MPPMHGATAIASVLPMRAADGMRLSTQTDIAVSREGVRRMLQGLLKRRAAVSALAVEAGPHVDMSVNVNDGYRPGVGYIAKVMSIIGLVSSAQDHRHGALAKNPSND